MLLVRFDYDYNVKVCVALGVLQSLAWLAWAFWSGHPYRWRLLGLVGVIHVTVLLEVLDFPPAWGAVDAHAAWHAATPPLAAAWYAFVSADAEHFASPKAGAAARGRGDAEARGGEQEQGPAQGRRAGGLRRRVD